jgi:hypothetical protein
LGRSSAGVGALFQPQEHILKLNHTGIGEKKSWVVFWDKGRAWDNGVAVFGEKVQKLSPYLRT